MQPVLTFIVPVRHHENAPNWNDTVHYLKQTLTSIANQTDGDWNCLVVANSSSELPPFEDNRISLVAVDFDPNRLHERGDATQEEFHESFRFDKGRRVLSAMNSGKLGKFYMIVDDDDFVHENLVSHAKSHPNANGWFINKGYVWGDQGKLLMKFDRFDRKCGSSLIIKSSVFDFSTFSEKEMKLFLGSHMFVKDNLKERGLGLAELPFYGAVYRIGHRNAHSSSKSLLRQFYINKKMFKSPQILFARLGCLKVVSQQIRREFALNC
ncbi:glycosyltransferase family A protein [Paraglaciecola sp.]|uniref:glycosyltransferase family A protein n=1 Tax=Paraglaciecola sp. TaxID=1920173 RepID=UPI00273F61B4|nr:glycosyltransferase family A protein [Paraglaciecola sp.]MDP5030967.1 glycosyltransferase family 2 protein [Paraglaciecola sp.]